MLVSFLVEAGESRRALNVAQLIKMRIERMNAVCALQASDAAVDVACGIDSCRTPPPLQRSTKREVYP